MKKTRIYTDGACSKNPGPGGWAAVLLFPTGKQEIAGYEEETTNNRMELKAVIEAVKLAMQLGYEKIDVYSDSAYVINPTKERCQGLKRWENNGWKTTAGKDVKNKDLWLKFIKLLKKNKLINMIKVKGHSGDKYNERVDSLARNEYERRK